MTLALASGPVVTAVGELLDRCAGLTGGERVVVLAAVDGLHGGANLVDEATVAAVAAGVRQRGASPTVIWVELDAAPHAWHVPPVLKAALGGADLLVSHAFDLPFEELYELREALAERGVPMIRNMATTTSLLASDWAQTPYELVSEIRYRTAGLFTEGEPFRIAHPNGTDLEGRIGPPMAPFREYAERRSAGLYRPFPEGVYTPITVAGTGGRLVFDRTLSWWARFIGVPPRFEMPVEVEIEDNRIRSFKGGAEADAFARFFAWLAGRFGSSVYEVAGLHGGIHPNARVPAHQCPDAAYREFVDHHHAGSTHLHLGAAPRDRYPYMLHVTAELRDASLWAGSWAVSTEGRLSVLDDPAIGAIAARYPGRPGFTPHLPDSDPVPGSAGAREGTK